MVKHCISGSSGPNGLHLSRLHHSNRCLTFVFGHIAIPIPAPRRQLSHPPSAIKVGKSAMFLSDHLIPFDAVLWSGTSSPWIYMAIFCPWPNRTIRDFFEAKKTNVSHKKSPILQPGIDMLERSRTMTWLRKVDPPVQNNKSMMGFQVFCACLFWCFLHRLLVFSLKYPLPSLYSEWTDSLHLDQIAIR